MKLYCHINEYAPDTLSSITSMLLLGERVVLSSPCGAFLEEGRSTGFPLTLTELVGLVEQGSVQIAAREQWFVRSQREKHPWQSARQWIPEFDGKISAMAFADRGLSNDAARVFILEPEQGNKFADRCVRNRHPVYHRAADLERRGMVPTGTRERFRFAKSEDDRIRGMLRDAYNHERARRDSGCQLAVEPELAAGLLVSLVREKRADVGHLEDVDLRRLQDLLKLIRQLRPIRNFAELCAALKDVELYRHEFDKYLLNPAPLSAAIRAAIERGLKSSGAEASDVALTTIATGAGLVGLAVSACDMMEKTVARRTFIGVIAGAVALIAGVPGLGPTAETLGIKSAQFEGDRVWFALANARPNPTLAQIEAVLKIVDSL